MVKLHDLMNFYTWKETHVDMEKIHELEEHGLLKMKKHPEYPLQRVARCLIPERRRKYNIQPLQICTIELPKSC